MSNLFILSDLSLTNSSNCLGIVLSAHSPKTNQMSGYVNGKEDARIHWKFNSLYHGGQGTNDLEQEAELIAFRILQYSLSGDVDTVEKNCVITESTNHSILISKVVLNVIPHSIFYTASFQYDIWNSGYVDVEFDGFMGNFNRELVVAAKKRTLKSGDPFLFSSESNTEMCGMAILESQISETKWNASLYLIDFEINQLEGMRLISKRIGGFERDSTGENVRNSFETDFATIDKVKSHTRV